MKITICLAFVLTLIGCTKALDPEAVGSKHREDIPTHPTNKPANITPLPSGAGKGTSTPPASPLPSGASKGTSTLPTPPTSTAASMPIQPKRLVTVSESIYEPTFTLEEQESNNSSSDINYRYEGGWTRLMYATAKGNIDEVKNLVSKQEPDVSIRNNYNLNVFDIAAGLGHDEILKFLMSTYKYSQYSDIRFPLPIHHAIINKGTISTLETLKDYYYYCLPRFKSVNSLALLSMLGRQDVLNKLSYQFPFGKYDINHLMEFNSLSKFEKHQLCHVTILMYASYQGLLDWVAQLIAHGADINIENETRTTALMLASAKGHTQVVNYLIRCGADVNQEDHRGMTALTHAIIQKDNRAVVSLLVEHGARQDIVDLLDYNAQQYDSILKRNYLDQCESISCEDDLELLNKAVAHSYPCLVDALLDKLPKTSSKHLEEILLRLAKSFDSYPDKDVLYDFEVLLQSQEHTTYFDDPRCRIFRKCMEKYISMFPLRCAPHSFSFLLSSGEEVRFDHDYIELILRLINNPQVDKLSDFMKAYNIKTIFIDNLHRTPEKEQQEKLNLQGYIGKDFPISPQCIDNELGFTAANVDYVVILSACAFSEPFIKLIGNLDKLRNLVNECIQNFNEGEEYFTFATPFCKKEGEPEPELEWLGKFVTWLHEIGHQVHFKALQPSVSKDAKKITTYSTYTIQEFHAEHFVAWLLDYQSYETYDPCTAKHFTNLIDQAIANAPEQPSQVESGEPSVSRDLAD